MPRKKCSEDTEDTNSDIAVLKEQLKETKEFIKNMNDNHLISIYSRLNKIDVKIAYYTGGLAALQIVILIVIKFL